MSNSTEDQLKDDSYFIITDKGIMLKERQRDKVWLVQQVPPYNTLDECTEDYKFIRNATTFDI